MICWPEWGKKMVKIEFAPKCSILSPQNLGSGEGGPWSPNPCLGKQHIFEDKPDTGNIRLAKSDEVIV